MVFHDDAVHCAVGTQSGHVLLYDWRQVRAPVAKVEADRETAVAALAFQVRKTFFIALYCIFS